MSNVVVGQKTEAERQKTEAEFDRRRAAGVAALDYHRLAKAKREGEYLCAWTTSGTYIPEIAEKELPRLLADAFEYTFTTSIVRRACGYESPPAASAPFSVREGFCTTCAPLPASCSKPPGGEIT